MEQVRIAFIGLGCRGMGLMDNVLSMKDTAVTAVCDVYEDRIEDAKKKVKRKKKTIPFGTVDYKEVLSRDDVDIVIISASWQAHTYLACDSMRSGKFTALEVGGTYDIENCYKLVETYEETKTPFMFLENCCYGKRELMCLEMAKQGVFGKIVQCDGAYAHDLRNEVSFGKENRHYRLDHYINYNCDNYPTHDLGPIAKILGINENNRMTKLISLVSGSYGLHDYIAEKKKDDEALRDMKFSQADIVTTMIECENGETIRLTLDTTLPRFYSRGFTVHGTKALYQEDGDIVFIDNETIKKYGMRVEFDQSVLYKNAKKYEKKYMPEIWSRLTKAEIRAGHGGMDYIMLRDMIDCFRSDRNPPIDVYDAAAWMSVTALSKKSIDEGCVWVDIPDFKKK